MMAASLAYTIFVRRASWPVIAAIVALMAVAVWYVARKPSRMPPEALRPGPDGE